MSLKELDAKYGWLGKYVNAAIAAVVFIVVVALAKFFVTMQQHRADLAPLQALPAQIEETHRRGDALQARISVLEDFRAEQRVQADRIASSLADVSRQLSVQTALQTQADQRLKRIEDKLDRQ